MSFRFEEASSSCTTVWEDDVYLGSVYERGAEEWMWLSWLDDTGTRKSRGEGIGTLIGRWFAWKLLSRSVTLQGS